MKARERVLQFLFRHGSKCKSRRPAPQSLNQMA
jgi:hypothetical protein